MPLLDSFTVDHTRMKASAVRVAKTVHKLHGDEITVFDKCYRKKVFIRWNTSLQVLYASTLTATG